MKTMRGILAFVACFFFLGLGNISYASYSSYTMDGYHAVTSSEKAAIKERLKRKIEAYNARNSINYNNYPQANYVPVDNYNVNNNYSNDYVAVSNYPTNINSNLQNVNSYSNIRVAYNPRVDYVILQPNGNNYNSTYGLQKDSNLNSSNYFRKNNVPYINVESKYKTSGSYLSPEINRYILNKQQGYSIQEQVNYYNHYNYFFTYSNNEYNKGYSNSADHLRSYMADLVKKNFEELTYVQLEVEDDINLIKNALHNSGGYYSDIRIDEYDKRILNDTLSKLYKVSRQIKEDRITLNHVLKYY